MYAREIDDQEHTFGASGRLIMNGLVMYDRETETYWTHLPGVAAEGPLKGHWLDFVPSWQTTWAEWRRRNPSTLALDRGKGGSDDRYEQYYSNSQAGVMGETLVDDRLDAKQIVVGVDWSGEQVAYPFDELHATPVVNDVVGGMAVLMVFHTHTATGIVFERRIDGQTLTFEMQGEGPTLVDAETGSTWDGWEGVALAGPLEGQLLGRVRSTNSFWFSWKDWYPHTRVYGESGPRPE